MLNFLKHIVQLLVNPAKGWEDIEQDNDSTRTLLQQGYYPLIAVASLSTFFQGYHIGESHTFISLLQYALISFGILFVTLFLAELAFSTLFPSMTSQTDKEEETRRRTTFIVYCLAIMAIIEILINVVPFNFPVLAFLPVYLLVIIYKAINYLGVKTEHIGPFMLMSAFTTIAPIYLFSFFYNLFSK